MDDTSIQGLTALLAVLGGAFAKGAWDWMKTRKQSSAQVQIAQVADDTHIRGELWGALQQMQERTDKRIDALQAELDKSRREYVELLTEHAMLKAEHVTLKNEHDGLKIRYAALELRVSNAA